MSYIWFVPDPTLSAIDRCFDFVDNAVTALKHAFHRGERIGAEHGDTRSKVTERAAPPRRAKLPAAADCAVASKSKKAPATVSTVLANTHFYIVESITPTGTVFVVTDGGVARTECSTREFAERLLQALGDKS